MTKGDGISVCIGILHIHPSISAAVFHSIFVVIIFSLLHIIISDWIYVCTAGIYISHLLSEHDTLSCVCVIYKQYVYIYSHVFPLRCHLHHLCEFKHYPAVLYIKSITFSGANRLIRMQRRIKMEETGTLWKRRGFICFSRFLQPALSLSLSFAFTIFTLKKCFHANLFNFNRSHIAHTHEILLISCHSLIYFSAKRKSRNDAIPSTT